MVRNEANRAFRLIFGKPAALSMRGLARRLRLNRTASLLIDHIGQKHPAP